MRIGFDAKRLFFNSSGLGNYARFHAGIMREMPGFESIWLSPQSASRDGLQAHCPKRSYPGFRSWGMGKWATHQGIEIYHGLSNELPFDWPSKQASVVSVHDTIFLDYPDYYSRWDRMIYRIKLQSALQKAHAVVATSEFTKSRLESYFPTLDNVQVIYQGLHPEFTQFQDHKPLTTERPYFIYHSTFNARKNHRTLLEAFSLIHKQCDWDLVLIGRPGSEWKALNHWVSNQGFGNRVAMLCDLPQSELMGYLRSASAFVYPSFSEGFGIPLIEAQAMGLPMAVSRIPVFEELLAGGALYFHPNNSEEMASAMLELQRSETRIRLLSESQQQSQRWERHRIREQWATLYNQLTRSL